MNFKQASLIKNWTLKEVKHWLWEIQQEFIWYIDFKTKNEYVIIPKWFATNLGSIPHILRSFIDYTRLSYILHDFLYSRNGKIIVYDINKIKWWYALLSIWWPRDYLIPTRRQADKILRDALITEWMSKYKAIIVYIWVRLFGFLYFKNRLW